MGQRVNKFRLCVSELVGTSLLVVTAMFAFAQTAHAQSDSSLIEVRAIYEQYTPENFDDGGAVSHYVWKNFVSFFPHATVARTAAIRARWDRS